MKEVTDVKALNIVIFGLSITSSWGNGHATTFRSLIKALSARGHSVTFFEKNVPWYANNRDMPKPKYCDLVLYSSIQELPLHHEAIASADLILIGSYVADTSSLLEHILRLTPACLAYYDIDTPVTLARLKKNNCEYLNVNDIPLFDLYLSFAGGPTLEYLEKNYGAQRARAFYCSVDTDLYYFDPFCETLYDLGYLGTYSDDRQPTLHTLLLEPSGLLPECHFCVAGAAYPNEIQWPQNVTYVEHIAPYLHRKFYCSQRFTLNVTRQDMISAGYSPSVRLFEAAACGTPIISDFWQGLDSFFNIGDEILIADSAKDVKQYLSLNEEDRVSLGNNLRKKVLHHHTNHHRAIELEEYWFEASPYCSQAYVWH